MTVIGLPASRQFVRPYRIGLLPGRIFAAGQEQKEIERALKLGENSFKQEIVHVDRPAGYWRYSNQVLCWIGTRTDSLPPVTLPSFLCDLEEAVYKMNEAKIVLFKGRILDTDLGWIETMTSQEIERELPKKTSTGISGLFLVEDDIWEVEVYSNGMMWAETPARLAILCARISSP